MNCVMVAPKPVCPPVKRPYEQAAGKQEKKQEQQKPKKPRGDKPLRFSELLVEQYL